ncbi:serine protease [Mucilaginibacter sp. HMF5004]|uniref:S1C family serine protease n=1 Tax=Mucilaginibacter rivuli TaxID=2857527 RepID=UPI001C5F161C|nr:S1C family serine protease [Mucilaginibacter rivuli]MBW4889456.1 serine protease [Mucilaginibacter rivuli]
MSDIELMAVIERYLNGEMNAAERARFELLRHDNEAVDARVKEHQEFTDRIKQYGERLQFESMLNEIHDEIDVQALKDELVHHPSAIVRLWRNHHSKISVAASITIFAVLGTLFLTGYMKSQSQEAAVINLKHDVDIIKRKQTYQISNIHAAKKIAPDNYGGIGTGFAISSNGYIVTNFHVVNGADSVYVQNADGDAFHAKIVTTDAVNDLAVLKITDPSFKSLGALPYGFKRGKLDLGEDLFTLGYSKDDQVLSKGYLSSGNGYKGDTVNYQIAMDVNFGNSGGPVLDSRGNIVGVVSSKPAGSGGSAYAIKSKYLIKSIQADTSVNSLSLSSKSKIANLSRTQQIEKLQNYVFMVKVYNR